MTQRPDRRLYRKRYLVEVFFHSLERFRGIATRFDKARASFLAFVHLAYIARWLDETTPTTTRGPLSSSRSTGLHLSMCPMRPR
jgi:hypothetical protein